MINKTDAMVLAVSLAIAVIIAGFWGTAIYVAYHFLAKYW